MLVRSEESAMLPVELKLDKKLNELVSCMLGYACMLLSIMLSVRGMSVCHA